MTAGSPDPPPTPQGRYRYLGAYARAIRSLLGAATVTFLLSVAAANRAFRSELLDTPASIARLQDGRLSYAMEAFELHFAAPLFVSYPDFLASRLTYEPIAAFLVLGLAAALLLEAYERR